MKQSFGFMLGLAALVVAAMNCHVRGEGYTRGMGECPALVRTQVATIEDSKDALLIGSGTCVTPDGYIVSCGHSLGDANSKVEVRFANGEKFIGVVVLKVFQQGRNATGDDIGIIKVSAPGPLPHRALAYYPPSPGERLIAEGYPNGRYAKLSTAVMGVVPRTVPKFARTEPPQFPGFVNASVSMNIFRNAEPLPHPEVMVLNHRAQHGNSGGPIFDLEGDLVGVTLTVPKRADGVSNEEDFRTAAISSRECARFLTKAKARHFLKVKKRKRPRLLIVVSPMPRVADRNAPCPPCELYQRDYYANAELRKYIDAGWDAEVMPGELIPEFCKAYGISATPAFVASNLDNRIEGYRSPNELMKGLAGQLEATPVQRRKAVEFITLPDPEQQELKGFEMSDAVQPAELPTPQAPEEPKPKGPVKSPTRTDPIQNSPSLPEPDLALAKVIWLIPTKAWVPNWLGGVATKLEKSAGPVVGKISAASGGKLVCGTIFQRIEAERFAAVCSKSKLDPLKGGFVVVVPKTFQGLAGAVAGIVEKAVGQFSFLDAVPVKEFFQRDSPEVYGDVVESITADYEEGSQSNDPVKPEHQGMASLGVIFLHLVKKLRPGKAVQT